MNVAVSFFTNPEIAPPAVNGSPSYTLEALSVVTVRVAGLILIKPFTYLMFSFFVTSTSDIFLITRVLQVAVTGPFAT